MSEVWSESRTEEVTAEEGIEQHLLLPGSDRSRRVAGGKDLVLPEGSEAKDNVRKRRDVADVGQV